MTKVSGLAFVVLGGAWGCAAAGRAPEAPTSAAPAPPAAAVVSVAPPGEMSESPLLRARREIDDAARGLEAAMGSCQTACRALDSMDRATGRLCGLASSREERRSCDDAKATVVATRQRVQASCSSCPGGPTLDPSAPVPSR